MLALHHDELLAATQLQVDAAVELRAGGAGTDVLDLKALAAVVRGKQRFQMVPTDPGECVVAPMRDGLESFHSRPPAETHCT